jgi:hypothetical protein
MCGGRIEAVMAGSMSPSSLFGNSGRFGLERSNPQRRQLFLDA